MKNDIQQQITDTIINMMETAGADWSKEWSAVDAPHNIASGKNYTGINTLVLSAGAVVRGYKSNVWGTYKQWADKGAQVKKGEKATGGIFYKTLEIKDKETDEKKRIPMLREFKLFNADQVEGYDIPATVKLDPVERDLNVDRYVAATGAAIGHGGDSAFFMPGEDRIQMPRIETFTSTNAYYATLLHELTHWTGHKSRLDRLTHARFGSEDYAKEELVAELGAAFQCQLLGVTSEPMENHAKYLNSWIKVLKDDKKAIFKASALAQKAVTLVESYSQPADEKAA